jgi:hypothetical protein
MKDGFLSYISFDLTESLRDRETDLKRSSDRLEEIPRHSLVVPLRVGQLERTQRSPELQVMSCLPTVTVSFPSSHA